MNRTARMGAAALLAALTWTAAPAAAQQENAGNPGEWLSLYSGARTLGISIEPTTKDKNGKLVSVHGTQVVAFSPKTNAGYVLYGEDATVDDYTKDLPKIIKGEKP